MRNAHAPVLLGVLALVVSLAWTAPVRVLAQQDLQPTPDLVVGRWRGELQIQSRQEIRTVNLELEIRAAPSLTGQFTSQSGGTWKTPVGLEEGKVMMGYDGERRGFVLKKGSGGDLFLETTYEKVRQVRTTNTVRLRKETP